MPKNEADNRICSSQEDLAREMETLGRLLRDFGCRECLDEEDENPGRQVVAIARLCRDLPLEEWQKLAKSPEFSQWLALPVNAETYPHLLHLQERLESLSYQSEHDPLTELYNRRPFERALKLELQRAERGSTYLSLAIIDMDNFKQVNDTYGHPCGDEVLVTLANTMIRNKRTYDLAARLGGEEFALLLPGAGPNKAQSMLERMLAVFRETPIRCTGVDEPLHLTFSVGVACTRHKVRIKAGEFMRVADKALYLAKEKGRNNVTVLRAPREAELPKATMVRAEEKQFLFTGSK